MREKLVIDGEADLDFSSFLVGVGVTLPVLVGEPVSMSVPVPWLREAEYSTDELLEHVVENEPSLELVDDADQEMECVREAVLEQVPLNVGVVEALREMLQSGLPVANVQVSLFDWLFVVVARGELDGVAAVMDNDTVIVALGVDEASAVHHDRDSLWESCDFEKCFVSEEVHVTEVGIVALSAEGVVVDEWVAVGPDDDVLLVGRCEHVSAVTVALV